MADDLNFAQISAPFALFDNNYLKGASSYLFHELVEMIEVPVGADVSAALLEIENHLARGHFAAGFISYEGSNGLALNLPIHHEGFADQALPALKFGIFSKQQILDDAGVEAFLAAQSKTGHYDLQEGQLSQSQGAYQEALLKVQEHIEAGDTYQLNYTARYDFAHQGDEVAFYQDLRHAQSVQYGALMVLGGAKLLSRSPELFFKKQDGRIVVSPMKGTALRGTTEEADRLARNFLQEDDKNRSENIIIVDLLRNDLGRIADTGTVQVEKLLEVETYETVHQMTSTIACNVDQNISLDALFSNLFPCGSITGAPKKRTMEIIADLETSPRGIYTGSMGYILPNRDMCFNVAIRTIEMLEDGACKMGLGGGIVAQSDPKDEYKECLNKGRFLFNLMAEKQQALKAKR